MPVVHLPKSVIKRQGLRYWFTWFFKNPVSKLSQNFGLKVISKWANLHQDGNFFGADEPWKAKRVSGSVTDHRQGQLAPRVHCERLNVPPWRRCETGQANEKIVVGPALKGIWNSRLWVLKSYDARELCPMLWTGNLHQRLVWNFFRPNIATLSGKWTVNAFTQLKL